MLHDRFDKLMAAALLMVIALALVLLFSTGGGSREVPGTGQDRQLEQEIAYQARLAFLERRFGPVVTLRDQGAHQEALLKLEELSREFPAEAHNDMLRGDILFRMGVVDRSLTSLATAVRRNGDYVDEASPLEQRDLIEEVVLQGIPLVRDRLRRQGGNPSLEAVLQDGYYLQSRLAGGCE